MMTLETYLADRDRGEADEEAYLSWCDAFDLDPADRVNRDRFDDDNEAAYEAHLEGRAEDREAATLGW